MNTNLKLVDLQIIFVGMIFFLIIFQTYRVKHLCLAKFFMYDIHH